MSAAAPAVSRSCSTPSFSGTLKGTTDHIVWPGMMEIKVTDEGRLTYDELRAIGQGEEEVL